MPFPAVFRHRPATALLVLAAATALAGCAHRAATPPAPAAVPDRFKQQAPARAEAGAPASVTPAWWRVFNDPVLDDLQSRLLVGNETLKAALARATQARAALQASRAARWPSLTAGLDAGRGRGRAQNDGEARARITHDVALAADARWEVDLWGRLSREVEAAQATEQASQADIAALRLSAQATLTELYLALRAAEARHALIGRNLVGLRRSLELTQARLQSGVAAPTDVLQAQTQLKLAEAQQVEAATERAQLEHAIATLLGLPPAALDLAPTAALPQAPSVPAVLPAALLERRPDIAAAHHRLAAALADVGAAQTAFLPGVTLSAQAGWRGQALRELASSPNLFWSIGASLVQQLFDAGLRDAVEAQARAALDEAGASYRQTVLASLQEVEDNLVAADRLQAQAALQAEAFQFAQRLLAITQEQYRVGTVSYLNVVTAQTSALDSERTLLEIRLRELAAVNQLLKNVAGPWDTRELPASLR